jgi:DNA-binding MarR family transcriptional regulator
MSPDSLVANPGRLRILTALAVEPRQPFVVLRKQTGLTDGNLASHAKRLESAGLIGVEKTFENGKPVTTFVLTPEGRGALEAHARRVLAALSHRRITTAVLDNNNAMVAATQPPTSQAA